MSRTRLFHGGLISPVSIHEAQYLERALLAVSSQGIIEWVENDVDPIMIYVVALAHGLLPDSVEVHKLKYGEWLMPGFVDTHTHAPQFPNIGIGGQYELLDWLNNVTFPTESRFSDLAFAERVYSSVVERVLNFGTTTCCYYGTLHLEATKLLANIVSQKGQRAFVGKCNMDRNSIPSYQEPSAEQSFADTEALITYTRSLSPSNPLVHPILTPRFAISCTSELLTLLGKLAQSDKTLAIQTHISENPKEIEFTRQLFPNCSSYAGVYKDHGLLCDRTILAHAVHLTEEELVMVKECGAGVSHCPTSNFYLNSGVCKVGDMLDRGIKVGLGTDCSGGFSPSILSAVRDAVIASKVVAMSPTSTPPWGKKLANRTLPLATLLHLSTLGGAQLCNLSSQIGSLQPGKEFDAILVSVRSEAGNPGVWANTEEGGGMPRDKLPALLEKFFMCGDDRNVRRVWVRGRQVGGVDK